MHGLGFWWFELGTLGVRVKCSGQLSHAVRITQYLLYAPTKWMMHATHLARMWLESSVKGHPPCQNVARMKLQGPVGRAMKIDTFVSYTIHMLENRTRKNYRFYVYMSHRPIACCYRTWHAVFS